LHFKCAQPRLVSDAPVDNGRKDGRATTLRGPPVGQMWRALIARLLPMTGRYPMTTHHVGRYGPVVHGLSGCSVVMRRVRDNG
jgi:hypothetical protein